MYTQAAIDWNRPCLEGDPRGDGHDHPVRQLLGHQWGDRGFGVMSEEVAARMVSWDQVWAVVVR
jgi:hypothetical protein